MQTLNIGLDTNDGKVLGIGRIANSLENHGYTISKISVVESDTEPTAVVDVIAQAWAKNMYSVAQDLAQDAIAVSTGGDLIQGVLVGPSAENWGEFNPEYFFMHDGTRMSARSGVVA